MTDADALQSVVMARVRELISYRKWIKAHPSYTTIAKLDPEYRAELRSLVKLVRMARKVRAESLAHTLRDIDRMFPPEQADAVTAAKGYHDWQAAGPV